MLPLHGAEDVGSNCGVPFVLPRDNTNRVQHTGLVHRIARGGFDYACFITAPHEPERGR